MKDFGCICRGPGFCHKYGRSATSKLYRLCDHNVRGYRDVWTLGSTYKHKYKHIVVMLEKLSGKLLLAHREKLVELLIEHNIKYDLILQSIIESIRRGYITSEIGLKLADQYKLFEDSDA